MQTRYNAATTNINNKSDAMPTNNKTQETTQPTRPAGLQAAYSTALTDSFTAFTPPVSEKKFIA